MPAFNDEVLNEAVRRTDAVLLDFDDVLCPGGEPIDAWPGVDGEVRPDGVHFSESSSVAMARLWGPELVALAS